MDAQLCEKKTISEYYESHSLPRKCQSTVCGFSSPEPKGELIVYQSLRRPSVRQHFQTSSPTTGPIELKFHMETP